MIIFWIAKNVSPLYVPMNGGGTLGLTGATQEVGSEQLEEGFVEASHSLFLLGHS